jgi:hypothetical protein
MTHKALWQQYQWALKRQRRAGWMVQHAVAAGLLPSLRNGTVPCRDCGKPAQAYDHRDYREPLVVEPVCHGCKAKRGPAQDLGPIHQKWQRTEQADQLLCEIQAAEAGLAELKASLAPDEIALHQRAYAPYLDQLQQQAESQPEPEAASVA